MGSNPVQSIPFQALTRTTCIYQGALGGVRPPPGYPSTRRRRAGLKRGGISLRPGAFRARAMRGGSPGCACPPSPPPPSSSGGCPAGAVPAADSRPNARGRPHTRRLAQICGYHENKKNKKKCGLHSRGLPCCTACPQGPSCTSRPRMGSHRVSRLPALRVGRRP